MHIRITNIPSGEAPEHIRKAWVGVVLPVSPRFAGWRSSSFIMAGDVPILTPSSPRFAGRHSALCFGLLSRPKSFLGRIIAILRGKAQREVGYTVEATAAIEALASHSPQAAAWWRENVPHAIAPGQYFMFAAEACEEIP